MRQLPEVRHREAERDHVRRVNGARKACAHPVSPRLPAEAAASGLHRLSHMTGIRRLLVDGEEEDDADVRGEHRYDRVQNTRTVTRLTVEEVLMRRKAGHYAAGADGTQEVSEPEWPGDSTRRTS